MIIPIIGHSGTGKSSSIRGLDPNVTAVVKCEKKPLPFKEAVNFKEGVNLFTELDYTSVVTRLQTLSKDKKFKFIVVDDPGLISSKEYRKVINQPGWDKFVPLAIGFSSIHIKALEFFPEDVIIFIMYHEDVNKFNQVEVKAPGNMFNKDFNPLERASICLQTHVDYGDDGLPTYHFITNKFKDSAGKVSASKSPPNMFETIIPNDLGYVVKKIEEFAKTSSQSGN